MKKVNCILLVDDNDADNLFHSRAIRKAGVCEHLEIATGGQDGLDYLAKSGDTPFPRPDIIFLDINMPGMNGFEFLEDYGKLDPMMKSKIVVFMLSSSLMPQDNEKAVNSGEVLEFLNKPLSDQKVREIVDRYF